MLHSSMLSKGRMDTSVC